MVSTHHLATVPSRYGNGILHLKSHYHTAASAHMVHVELDMSFRKLSDANAMPGNFRGFEPVRMKTLRGEACSLGLDARTWRPPFLDRAHIRSGNQIQCFELFWCENAKRGNNRHAQVHPTRSDVSVKHHAFTSAFSHE